MRIMWFAGMLFVIFIGIIYVFLSLKREYYDSIEIGPEDYNTLDELIKTDEDGTASFKLNAIKNSRGKITTKEYKEILKIYHKTNAV